MYQYKYSRRNGNSSEKCRITDTSTSDKSRNYAQQKKIKNSKILTGTVPVPVVTLFTKKVIL